MHPDSLTAHERPVLRPQDADKLPGIIRDMREVLEGDMGVDKRLPCFVGLSGFEEAACNILLLVYTTPRATRDWGNFRQSLLFRMHSIITQRGASLTYPTQVGRHCLLFAPAAR